MTVSNGSLIGSTPSPIGLGPGENVSGCSKASLGWWFWLLGISHLLLMVSVSA